MKKTKTAPVSKRTRAPGGGRKGKGGRSVTIRLGKQALQDRTSLAAAWRCDATAVIERALAEAALRVFTQPA